MRYEDMTRADLIAELEERDERAEADALQRAEIRLKSGDPDYFRRGLTKDDYMEMAASGRIDTQDPQWDL